MPNEEDSLTPGERELEAALGRLTPARPAIDVSRIMTSVVVRTERRRTRLWQAAAALFAVAAGAAMALRPNPRVVERIVYREAPGVAAVRYDSPSPPLVHADFAYLKMRNRVMAYGVDVISDESTATASDQPIRVRTQAPVIPRTPWYIDMLAGGRS